MAEKKDVTPDKPRRSRVVSRVRWPETISLTLLGIIVLGSVLAPILAPYDPIAQSSNRLQGSSLAHIFGTDELGRDLFSRVMHGGQLTMSIAAGATFLSMILGIAWGMIAAFLRGLPDEILMRLADSIMAIPQILLALVFISALGAGPWNLAVIVGLLLTPTTARLVRSSVLAELEEDYFTAAIAFGSPRYRLLLVEVLPNIRGPLTVQTALNMANAILLEASLSFVGLGIAPPEATWGTLVQQGFTKIYQSVNYIIYPALLIFLVIWLLNVLADQLGGSNDLQGKKR